MSRFKTISVLKAMFALSVRQEAIDNLVKDLEAQGNATPELLESHAQVSALAKGTHQGKSQGHETLSCYCEFARELETAAPYLPESMHETIAEYIGLVEQMDEDMRVLEKQGERKKARKRRLNPFARRS